MGIVYLARNKHTNKVYIGITQQTLSKRKSDHKYDALTRGKRTVFHDAIRCFGFENFVWEILCETKTNNRRILECKEQQFIKYYDAVNNGYNQQYRK